MINKLVSCPEEPPPGIKTGEPTVEDETEGERLPKRELTEAPAIPPLAPCDSDEKLASEDASRGLPVAVGARERWPE